MPAVKTDIPVLDLGVEIDELWDELNHAIQGVLRSGAFILGPEVQTFEQEVAEYLGTRHAVGVNSGTDALVIALRALDIGDGDEVITTPFSFFATAESIGMVGAKPVFVDIEEDSFNIDPSRIEMAMTDRTRAIMPVHLFGRPANMDAIAAVAHRHGLKVVEDCAQSFGAVHYGSDGSRKQTGTIGDLGAYSFFPSKNLGAYGDGGLIATDDGALADRVRMLRAHGAKKKYHNEILGYNSRLDSIQAAILRVKLPHIDRFNEGRRTAAVRYGELLSGIGEIIAPEVMPGHVFHQYTIRIRGVERDAVKEALAAEGISTMVYYPVPQDRLPVYEGLYPRYARSDEAASEVLSLPIWPGIPPEVQQRVADAIEAACV